MIRRLKHVPLHLFERHVRRVPKNARAYPSPEIRIYVQRLHQEFSVLFSVAWAPDILARRSGFTITFLIWGLAITWNPARVWAKPHPEGKFTVTEAADAP